MQLAPRALGQRGLGLLGNEADEHRAHRLGADGHGGLLELLAGIEQLAAHQPRRGAGTDEQGLFHEQGVQIYLDDFGTGYSSLSYLNRLPVDKVKIDRSFIAGLPSDPGHVALVQSIIGMAHALELKVVAEGVETRAQLEMLQTLGCDAVQGYLFARPLSAEEIVPLLGRDLRSGQKRSQN